jgi:cobalamin biosynthesis protein CobW
MGRFADDPERLQAQRGADPSIAHDNPLEEVYEDQLLCADLVVLNKADLVSPEAQRAIAADIATRVPRAVKIVPAREGRIDVEILLGLDARAEDDLSARPSRHETEAEHDHDDFSTFFVELGPIRTPDLFLNGLGGVAARHDVLRIKGFVEVSGKPLRLLVQGVGTRFQSQFDRPWRADEPRRGSLVIIGERGLDAAAIRAEIERLAEPEDA